MHTGKGIQHDKRTKMHRGITGQRFEGWGTSMSSPLGAWRSVSTSEGYWGAQIEQLSSRGFCSYLNEIDVWKTIRTHFNTFMKWIGASFLQNGVQLSLEVLRVWGIVAIVQIR